MASLGRPFVVYKVATTLDGRVTVPGARWLTGEPARRRVHELRAPHPTRLPSAWAPSVADAPRLDARDVPVARQPRRLAFGRGPLPPGSELELRPGALFEELEALAAEGVQSVLLEGGPTLATAFLEAGPGRQASPLRGADARRVQGRRFLGELSVPARFSHVSAGTVGRRPSRRGVPARAIGR